MNNNVLISVIMSTLNTPIDYLKESIDSILNQTFTDFEFIIVVDGGNDDEFILNNYSDKRIKIIKHKESMGLPYSLNEAIKKTKGKYIARMDSDDISLPNRLKFQYEYMEKKTNIDICGTFYKTFGSINKKEKRHYTKYNEVRSVLFFVNCLAHPTMFFRKQSLIDKRLLYNSEYKYSQDFELWNQNLDLKIEILPRICFLYRIHNNQISSQKKDEQNKLYYSVLIKNLKRMNFSEEQLEYLLVLNGRKKNKNYKKIYDFIEKLINRNNELNVYKKDVYKKVLLRQFCVYAIKNRCFINFLFAKNFIFLLKK